jgi:hypothetical protein
LERKNLQSRPISRHLYAGKSGRIQVEQVIKTFDHSKLGIGQYKGVFDTPNGDIIKGMRD